MRFYTIGGILAMWTVRYLNDAAKEREVMPAREKVALDQATAKLEVLGPVLPYPHQSAVREAPGLRELRPRAGRSAWRALYRRVEDSFLVAAVGPEAQSDRRGFDRMVKLAVQRLEDAKT